MAAQGEGSSKDSPSTAPLTVEAEEPPLSAEADQPPTFEAEPDDYADNDSTFGSLASSTTSIGSSILKHREENGRRYHAYKEGRYVLPNDEEENDRLDLQHHLILLTQDGKLFMSPIPKDKALHRVLDAGTGTGIWAIDFADEHPESQVTGVDLSPIQPPFVPPNLTFEIDDLEEPWTFSQKFDFIYTRMLTGSLDDWPKYFSQALSNLQPGGYLELLDLTFPGKVDDGTWPENSALLKWAQKMHEAVAKFGREADSARRYKDQMIEAGFENVVEIVYKWPQNRWPKDPKLKELGLWNLANLHDSLSGISMALFTRGLGWTAEELEVFLVDVRREMKDTRIHAYYDVYVVYGQKPA